VPAAFVFRPRDKPLLRPAANRDGKEFIEMKPELSENDPQRHVANLRRMLNEVIAHCREDIEKVSEPKAQVLFETTAEVLRGLETAYEHYATGAEPAMRA
jgi:hypothetical protein